MVMETTRTPNSDGAVKWGSSIVSSGELSLRRLKIDRWGLVACFRCSVVSPLYFPLGVFAEVKEKFILAGTVYIGATATGVPSHCQLPNTVN